MSDFQFVWIMHGSAEWQYAHQARELRPGQLVLVQPGMRDHWQWDRRQPTMHGYVYFNLSASKHAEHRRTWPLVRPTGEDDPLPAMLRYLLRLDVTSSDDLATAAELVRFVLVLFGRGPNEDSAPVLPAALESVVDHVYRAWAPSGVARAVSLAELAAAATVSTRAPLQGLPRPVRRRASHRVRAVAPRPRGDPAVAERPADHRDRPIVRLRRPGALLAPVPPGVHGSTWPVSAGHRRTRPLGAARRREASAHREPAAALIGVGAVASLGYRCHHAVPAATARTTAPATWRCPVSLGCTVSSASIVVGSHSGTVAITTPWWRVATPRRRSL